jgi:hypothetical protein
MNVAANSDPQFRVLYRQFLFRVVDLEVLSSSAQGDANKLLGRFAALLVWISAGFAFFAMMIGNIPSALKLATEHVLVATTVLVVGIFAVLSWDSIFPDRRDVLVLAPLPVRARTIFLAKVSATATALGLVVVLLHCGAGLTWSFRFAPSFGFVSLVRAFAAYWFTMFAAAAFVYCAMLAIQGLAAQLLPRRIFLRTSGFLQTAAFCLFICVYFLGPPVDSLKALTAPEHRRALAWVPTYWFLGLLGRLNGSMNADAAWLARRAWLALNIAALAAAVAYALSYFRTIRKIVEEPDIAPSPRRLKWLPRFGGGTQTAVGQFSVRTLARSRQHRLIWAFYLGLGLACTILLVQSLKEEMGISGPLAAHLWRVANAPLLAASIMMMILSVVGLRVVFAFPLELRANWIFRIVGLHDGPKILSAQRRALLLLAVAPVGLVSAAVCLLLWPWQQAAVHLIALGLFGIMLVDAALYGFRKIPFACSYLPGKTHVNVIVVASGFVLVVVVEQLVSLEQQALQKLSTMVEMLVLLALIAAVLRWGTARARSGEEQLHFEEEDAAVLELGLYRDGVLMGNAAPESDADRCQGS